MLGHSLLYVQEVASARAVQRYDNNSTDNHTFQLVGDSKHGLALG